MRMKIVSSRAICILFTRFLVVGLVTLASGISVSALELASHLSPHCVLQRDASIPVWGKAEPSQTVTVELAGQQRSSQADANGVFEVTFQPMKAMESTSLVVSAGKDKLTVENVAIGDVWFCSGQSNMVWKVRQVPLKDEYVASAHQPRLRYLSMDNVLSYQPQTQFKDKWKVITPESVTECSTIGYLFAKEIMETQNVPVGIIVSAWGGTPVRAWTPLTTLKTLPTMNEVLQRYEQATSDLEGKTVIKTDVRALLEKYEKVRFLTDTGNRGVLFGWNLSDFADASWQTMKLPTTIEKKGLMIDGALWFRLRVDVPPAWSGRDLLLSLGALDDFDQTYWNGEAVGNTGEETPHFYRHLRAYTIPGNLVKQGENVIAIRLFDRFAGGGFMGPESAMTLSPVGGNEQAIRLDTEWKYCIETSVLDPSENPDSLVKTDRTHPQYAPGVLYNAMVNPFARVPVRGFLWYQGESDVGQNAMYAEVFPAMIRAWRQSWGLGELPFFYVQLPSYLKAQEHPGEGGWGALRAAQDAALLLPNTGSAVILDAGEAQNIHPSDKATPAHRLALQARAKVYGESLPCESPRLKSHRVEIDGKVYLQFNYVYDGLKTVDGSAPKGFVFKKPDGSWVWANVEIISADTVVVSHPDVLSPQAVAYAWASNPVHNLINSAGFPMSGFLQVLAKKL